MPVYPAHHRPERTKLVRPGCSESIQPGNDRVVMGHSARAKIKQAFIFLRDDPAARPFTECVSQQGDSKARGRRIADFQNRQSFAITASWAQPFVHAGKAALRLVK